MTSDPEQIGKIYGKFKKVDYGIVEYSAQGNASDKY